MKLSTLHAAAFAMALAASSAQAVVIYEAPKELTCCTNYGPQTIDVNFGVETVNLWGDYIEFEPGTPRNLTRATFWLNVSDELSWNPDQDLTLEIQDKDLNPLTFNGTWSNVGDAYSYTFSQPLFVPTERITYVLVLDETIALSLTQNYLQLFASTGPTTGADVVDVPNGVFAGDVNVGSVEYGNTVIPLSNGYTIAARFDAVPEPATLALLSLGLVGVSFARRRKHAG